MKQVDVIQEILYDEILKCPVSYANLIVNKAYSNSKGYNKKLINFTEEIYIKEPENFEEYYDKDTLLEFEGVDKIVDCLKLLGVEYITMSNQNYGILEVLSEFEKCGCKVVGITQIKEFCYYKPAFKIKIS